MTQPIRNRSHLLLGCGSTALALALALAPEGAQAQAINAEGNVVFGGATFTTIDATTEQIDVFTPTTVIDWLPNEDAGGNALDFLPTGTTAIFQGLGPNFAVLNRILPATNGNVAVIDGTVIARFQDPTGLTGTAGRIAFYSPTGILIGDNARFDVGSLLLTTLDTSDAAFEAFAQFGAPLPLTGAVGSTARVQINPGAQILALEDNSFFAVVAADVQMLGTARVNGSHAFVAGEVVSLSFSNGLFDISVPVGTAAAGTVIEVDGTVGGPASNGVVPHIIYGVAAAQADPISMIFRGNLGFDPAQSAGVVNGEIILSANYDVFGRTVAGGSIADGINAVFPADSELGATRADIFVEDFTASSSLLAIGTHRTQVAARTADSSVVGNLLVVGRENAEVIAAAGQSLTVSGDVLVSAQDFGVVSSNLQTITEANAQGGTAVIDALAGGSIAIAGSALVTADALAGADDSNRIAGSAQGGEALIGANGGIITIDGLAGVSARGIGTVVGDILVGAAVRGGLAQVFARQGGSVTIGGSASLDASAVGAQGSLFNPSSVSDAFGGEASLVVFDGGGTIDIGGDADLFAGAAGGSSNTAGAGAIGDAGIAIANIDGLGTIGITGALRLAAEGTGGDNAGGTGGVGLGGRASAATFSGGTISIGDEFDARASGRGGSGVTGGDGFGGIAGANALVGTIAIAARAVAVSDGFGGSAGFGFGGDGGLGRGGSAFFQADGTLTETAVLTIGGEAFASATGSGGDGGQSDGQAIAAGRGGDGYGGDITVPNQADPAFGSGAFLLAGGDNGTLSIAGPATATASGFGGNGGNGGSIALGGVGGNGFGGLAQIGLALLGQDGSLGQGSASFSSALAEANGFGGSGGLTLDAPTGDGGDGTGGNSFLTVQAGEVIASSLSLDALGFGGTGAQGGLGTGGAAGAFGSLAGSLTTDFLTAQAGGFGGFVFGSGDGGDGLGGEAYIRLDGIDLTVNGDVNLNADGGGGSSGAGNGGDGIGGAAFIEVENGATPGTATVSGNAGVVANGFGGDTGMGNTGGTGSGGTAYVQVLGGGVVRVGSLQVTASGIGGVANVELSETGSGGEGLGGDADLRSEGAGSQLIVERSTSLDLRTIANGEGAILAALGFGGQTNGGAGNGGNAGGGNIGIAARQGGSITLPLDPANDPDSLEFNLFVSGAYGGSSSVEGGTGGTATGGAAAIAIEGGTIAMGQSVIRVDVEGGSGVDPTRNIAGGDAFGGFAGIVINGGSLTTDLLSTSVAARGGSGVGASDGGEASVGSADVSVTGGGIVTAGLSASVFAVGGDALGTGDGGDANAGTVRFAVARGTFNILTSLSLLNTATGGGGVIGGDATAGSSGGGTFFTADQATITYTPSGGSFDDGLTVRSNLTGGTGTVQGGAATGAAIEVTFTDSTVTGRPRFTVRSDANGGDVTAPGGIGGAAQSDDIIVDILRSDLSLSGETFIVSLAGGGSAPTGNSTTGGAAVAGTVDMSLTDSTLDIALGSAGLGTLQLLSIASGGSGDTVGAGTADRAALLVASSDLSVDDIEINSAGRTDIVAPPPGQTGGVAQSGVALLEVEGDATITARVLELFASAAASTNGTARAGEAVLTIAPGSTAVINADDMLLRARGFGSTVLANNIAGRFDLQMNGGTINAGNFVAQELGDAPSAFVSSQLVANGGRLNVSGNLLVETFGSVLIRTGAGGTIGGPRAPATTTSVQIDSGGVIRIEGDNPAAVGLGGDVITLSARDLEIAAGARVGADQIVVTSRNDNATAILGGTAQGAGFTLTADELARLSAGALAFNLPRLAAGAPNQPDLLIRDAALAGSGAGGAALVTIAAGSSFADGLIRIEGTLSYTNAGLADRLALSGGRIEVATPGGIRIADANGVPAGVLALAAGDVWVADAATLSQLQADRNFAGRDAQLATAAEGSADPLGYLRAGGITISAGNSLLVRNTGIAFEGGGILVGDGGLSILGAGGSQSGPGAQLDVVAYGRRRAADGSFVVGEAFFDEVNFNRAAPGSTLYLASATFNDCNITTGECPQAPPPPPPPLRPVIPTGLNNPTVVIDPVTLGEQAPISAEEEAERFGMDFPEQPDAPLISEDDLLDDPVSSGGDASLYSGDAAAAPRGGER